LSEYVSKKVVHATIKYMNTFSNSGNEKPYEVLALCTSEWGGNADKNEIPTFK
jgi:hypothetical protein